MDYEYVTEENSLQPALSPGYIRANGVPTKTDSGQSKMSVVVSNCSFPCRYLSRTLLDLRIIPGRVDRYSEIANSSVSN